MKSEKKGCSNDAATNSQKLYELVEEATIAVRQLNEKLEKTEVEKK